MKFAWIGLGLCLFSAAWGAPPPSVEDWCLAVSEGKRNSKFTACVKEQRDMEHRDAAARERAKTKAPERRARFAPVDAACSKLDATADGVRCAVLLQRDVEFVVLYIEILDPAAKYGENRMLRAAAAVTDQFGTAGGKWVIWVVRHGGVLMQRMCGAPDQALTRCSSLSLDNGFFWHPMTADDRRTWSQIKWRATR